MQGVTHDILYIPLVFPHLISFGSSHFLLFWDYLLSRKLSHSLLLNALILQLLHICYILHQFSRDVDSCGNDIHQRMNRVRTYPKDVARFTNAIST